MGFDGNFSVYYCNKKTKQYEKLAFYDKDGNELFDIFPSRDGMLNQLLLGYNRHGYDFEAIGAHRGVPTWYVNMLKKENPGWFNNKDGWNYNPKEGTYYDYLELKGWAQGDACNYQDWISEEATEDYAPVRNPLKDFMKLVNIYLEAYNIYYPKPGEVIIICEMSY